MFEVELDEIIVESFIRTCQVEITGRCNMKCQHCRAWQDDRVDMSFELYQKVLDFVEAGVRDDFRLTISGGEPFLHPNLIGFLNEAKQRNVNNIAITTNGSICDKPLLQRIKKLNFNNLFIQVSIDSDAPHDHDKFRGHKNAYKKAMTFFDITKELEINTSLRTSVTPKTIARLESLCHLALLKGAIRFGTSPIIPAGRGKNSDLTMGPIDKLKFIQELARCDAKFPSLEITTEDPTKMAFGNGPWATCSEYTNTDGVYGGCTAGISSINVLASGDVTPCAVFDKKIMNLNLLSADEAMNIYVSSKVIKDLFSRNFSGRCGSCKLKRVCGGCRAVPYGLTGDYMGEDSTCFKGIHL